MVCPMSVPVIVPPSYACLREVNESPELLSPELQVESAVQLGTVPD